MLRMSQQEHDLLKVISDVDRGLLKQLKAAQLPGLAVPSFSRV